MRPWQHAISRGTLRVDWAAAIDAPDAPREALLEALWTALRARRDPPGASQDERLEVRSLEPVDGGFRARVRYTFDHDFASQYDRTESFGLELRIDDRGELVGAPRWDGA
jgi:hypothetical protein